MTSSMTVVDLAEPYRLANPTEVATPAVAVYPALIRRNLEAVLAQVEGNPERLRPHAKTHKTLELAQLELAAGVTKHKCATLAEAELLARAGIRDVVLAYPLVGPNIGRFFALAAKFPSVSFKPLVDHVGPLKALAKAAVEASRQVEALLDVDVGMGRTGVPLGDEAFELYRLLATSPGLAAGGLHVYDGHNQQPEVEARRRGVVDIYDNVRAFAARLADAGFPVPRLVCGGTPSFPMWAELAKSDPRIECSPGTFFLNDANYREWFADLPLPPAAVVLTRVISRPQPGRITLDLGSKAVASDPPLERRVRLLNVPDAVIIKQSEEHLVVETPAAAQFQPGDMVYGWPAHICPTCALHRELLVVEDHRVTGRWPVLARDRRLEHGV